MGSLRDIFPGYTFLIFLSYMVFSVGQGIFVTISRSGENGYDYNFATVVLLTEFVKFALAVVCYLKEPYFVQLGIIKVPSLYIAELVTHVRDNLANLEKMGDTHNYPTGNRGITSVPVHKSTSHSLPSLGVSIRSNIRVLCLYLVPSFLYCIYNNLAFVNLSAFDPTTYFILLQLRVVITGIVFQVMFKKQLSSTQWFSLLFLTLGCVVQRLDLSQWFSGPQPGTASPGAQSTSPRGLWATTFSFILILIQVLCSCFAGVYNEYLLKGEGLQVNIFVQNIFMYLDSIFWNLLVLAGQGKLGSLLTIQHLAPILQPIVLIIVMNNALIGITTSLFLKNFNSIMKTFASAMELLFTALLSWALLGIPIAINTAIAIVIVSYSIYVYTRNPVNNRPKLDESSRKLIETA